MHDRTEKAAVRTHHHVWQHWWWGVWGCVGVDTHICLQNEAVPAMNLEVNNSEISKLSRKHENTSLFFCLFIAFTVFVLILMGSVLIVAESLKSCFLPYRV